MYTYPTRRTGTAQDMMTILTRSEELALARDGTVLPAKSPLMRTLIEPPCNLGGLLMRALLEFLSADLVLSIHDAIYRKLAGGRVYAFAPESSCLARAAVEARSLEAGGRPPALVGLVSHPPVLGELAHLNFELVRHACRALRVVRDRPCRPRLVVAVDPFALDTAGLPAEGLYAGCMGLYHLGFDRLAFARGRASASLVGETAWPNLAWRLLGRLRTGGEVVMALSGGVPATARVLYTVREWLSRQRRQSPLRGAGAEVLRRLRSRADFRDFEADGPHGPGLRRSAWRMMEAWAMSVTAGHPWAGQPQSPSCAETGVLTPQAREALAAGLEALDLPGTRRDAALAELAQEWSRETPYRRRFFRLLAGRLLKRGRPVLFLPVVHRGGDRPGIEVRDAWSWTALDAGRIRARALGEHPREWTGTAEEFAVEFGRRDYS